MLFLKEKKCSVKERLAVIRWDTLIQNSVLVLFILEIINGMPIPGPFKIEFDIEKIKIKYYCIGEVNFYIRSILIKN